MKSCVQVYHKCLPCSHLVGDGAREQLNECLEGLVIEQGEDMACTNGNAPSEMSESVTITTSRTPQLQRTYFQQPVKSV